jgi:propionyl-CoA carboxylase alpha chain
MKPCASDRRPSRESYLRADRIIEACKATGAQAVHPGYGFLSENEAFARDLGSRRHRVHRTQGAVDRRDGRQDRVEAPRARCQGQHDPAYTDVIADCRAGGEDRARRGLSRDDQGVRRRRRQGVARRAQRQGSRRKASPRARRKRKASFGDDRVFIEKFIEEPRHIEIQVLGDAHGNLVYLWERECSIQRRHQKVIEEAPSPFLDDATRRAMGEQAVALARAVDYQSAGTVEFVVGRDRSFYFPRDEHAAAGRASGHRDDHRPRSRRMDDPRRGRREARVRAEGHQRDGWAIECRINAEDPLRISCRRSAGLVRYVRPDREAGEVRVDTGVYEGGEIPMHYDSMIAKLIVHAPTRDAAASA